MTTTSELIRFNISEFHGVTGGVVDAGTRVIRDVAILGAKSGNGGRTRTGEVYTSRAYTSRAMAEGAPKYEGARVYLNHQVEADRVARHGSRDVAAMAGVLRNVRHDSDRSRLVGDLHTVESEPGRHVLSLASTCPECIGLSHDAEGQGFLEAKTLHVDEILRVFSVDVVDVPATNSTLFEGVRALDHKEAPVVDHAQVSENIDKAVAEAVKAATAPLLERAEAAERELASLEAEADERQAATELAEAVAATAELVAEVAEERNLSAPVTAKMVAAFKGRQADRSEIVAAVEAEVSYLAELGGDELAPRVTQQRVDQGSSSAPDGVADAALAEGVFNSLGSAIPTNES